MYSAAVKQAFDHPVHAGDLSGASGAAGSRALGTEVVFSIQVADSVISQMAFQAYGCPHTIAACELAVAGLLGKAPQTLENWAPDQVVTLLDIPVEKIGRLLFIQDALRNCWQDWDTNRLNERS